MLFSASTVQTHFRISLLLVFLASTRALYTAFTRRRLSRPRAPAVRLSTDRQWDGHPVLSAAQLLHPHTDVAHRYWAELLAHTPAAERVVVDATAGNGHDSLVLAQAMARVGGGTLVLCDVQQRAIDATRARLAAAEADCGGWPAAMRLEWKVGDHAALLEGMPPGGCCLVVFNLGYLPGGDKSLVTTAASTVRALTAAERAVRPGGCVSATIYPGHEEGRREEAAVLEHAAALPQGAWSVHYTQWLNQRSKRNAEVRAPSVCLIQRMHD